MSTVSTPYIRTIRKCLKLVSCKRYVLEFLQFCHLCGEEGQVVAVQDQFG